MRGKTALIIFYKNLVYGNVKTRLAATLGNNKALQVYKELVKLTQDATEKLQCDKWIYYSNFIVQDDEWKEGYNKAKQEGNDLGERIQNALLEVLQKGYEKTIIIGTDCPTISPRIINEAFDKLNDADVIIGPSADGGYYLLGLKKMYGSLFQNIAWSTSSVCKETINKCEELSLTYLLLPVLHDVDREEDLQYLTLVHHE